MITLARFTRVSVQGISNLLHGSLVYVLISRSQEQTQ